MNLRFRLLLLLSCFFLLYSPQGVVGAAEDTEAGMNL